MNQPASERTRAFIVLAAGAVCISFAAIFVKMLGIDKLGPTAIGFWRALFGGLILFGIGLLRRQNLRISRQMLRYCIVAGFLFFLDLAAWHRSIIYSGAGMATILANTQVFATAAISFFIFREKLTLKFMAAAVSALLGVALLVGIATDSVEFTTPYLKGIAYGLSTAIFYASYIVTVKRAGQKETMPDFVTFMGWTSMFTAGFLGVAMLVESDPILPPDLYSLGVLLLLALVAQALGWWAISSSLSKLEASRAGLALLLQPILATVWGVIFFAEYLAPSQVIGAVITLTAIYVGSIRRQRIRELS